MSNKPDERWEEYHCVECDPFHDDDLPYERPFVMMVPEADETPPDHCPRCGAFRSLMWVGTRDVRYGRVTP